METLAWAAGLFEGEGTVTTSGGRPRLALRMTDEEATRRFAERVGVGKVYGPYGPYASSMGKTPHFDWVVYGENAREAARRLWPWVGPRVRERMQEVGLIT